MRICLSWRRGTAFATLHDTPTAHCLFHALPFTAAAQTWGCEVYFAAPVQASLEPDARQVVDPGTVCFWVEGSSLAIPYGPTPVSRGTECRLVAKVNVLGSLEGDAQALAAVRPGEPVTVTAA
jgi:hypothetical protein